MNALELEFRKEILKTMMGLWAPIINAESKYNPGVPDLSYVMNGDCETGWLELKQDESGRTNEIRIHVEPGQHRFMETFAQRIPVHFLIARRELVYFLGGAHHRELSGPISHAFLIHHGEVFHREELRKELHFHLTAITKRK